MTKNLKQKLEYIAIEKTFSVKEKAFFKVNIGNTKTRCEICSKLTIKKPERHQCHFSYLVLVFLLLILSRQMPIGESAPFKFKEFKR